jgi:hypothetical protein
MMSLIRDTLTMKNRSPIEGAIGRAPEHNKKLRRNNWRKEKESKSLTPGKDLIYHN